MVGSALGPAGAAPTPLLPDSYIGCPGGDVKCKADVLQTAAYGHFGRELPEFTWERTDKAEELKKACGV